MNVLVVFAKDPARGKSRLAATIGRKSATQVARSLLVDAIELGRRAGEAEIGVSLAVADPTPETDATMQALAADLPREPQVGATLGERLSHSMQQWFARGAARVVIIGTDCPTLSIDEIALAFELLAFNDAVLGPASDGGYHLIGCSAPKARLFDGIDWDSPRVLEQTVAGVRRQRLSLRLVPQLSDIDTADDLPIVFGQLEARLTAYQQQGQATYWTLHSVLHRMRAAS